MAPADRDSLSAYSEASADFESEAESELLDVEPFLLQDKGAIVTAGATGVGAAVVRILAEAGAYVTIADSAANEGQRLMLELVSRNLRVQFTYTNLSSFRSQSEAFHHARSFSPHQTLDLVIAGGALPPPPSSSSSPSLLDWLSATAATDPAIPTKPANLPLPPTGPIDRGITGAMHSVHLALYCFRQDLESEANTISTSASSSTSNPNFNANPTPNTTATAAGATFLDTESDSNSRPTTSTDNTAKHIIILAPLSAYDAPAHAQLSTALAAQVAGQGIRALFGGVRAAVGALCAEGQGQSQLHGFGGSAVSGGSGERVRVNLIAVPEVSEMLEEGGAVRPVGKSGAGGVGEGRGEGGGDGEDGEGEQPLTARDCAEVVLEIACDEGVAGCALAVTAEGIRDVSAA